MNSLTPGFALDELRVEPLTGVLSGPGGSERLDPKVMDVLVEMAEHAGQVVLREDLHARLWPNVVVTDDAITRCFYELRRSLGHAGGDAHYKALLETVPKRGYRLNATVRPLAAPPARDDAPATVRRGTRWVSAAAAIALVAIGGGLFAWRASDQPKSAAEAPASHGIAVLPFLDMSGKKDQGYLADGVTEEILNTLSQAANLRVISRTSSFALRNETLDVPQIAARLDVAYVLEGSVRQADGRVRITAQLIDASTNSHVWSQTYDRSLDDLFAVQDEIAASVAAALQVTLTGDESRRHSPASIAAYENFLHGRFFYNRRSTGDIERAISYYKQAVALDPAYARAWAALAGAYSLQIGEQYANSNEELRRLQGEAALEAVRLDPGLAVAHARLAQYYNQVQEYEKGDEHLRTAVAINPDDPVVLGFTASEAIWRGDFGEALSLWRKVVELDPLSAVNRTNFGFMLLRSGHPEEALAQFRKALELNPDAGPALDVNIARTLILLGRFDEALATIARLPQGNLRDYAVALLHGAPGHRREADAALARLATAPRDIADEVHLGEAYANRGLNDEVLESLLRFQRKLKGDPARPMRDQWYFQDEIRLAPLLKPLHSDPRWEELAAYPG